MLRRNYVDEMAMLGLWYETLKQDATQFEKFIHLFEKIPMPMVDQEILMDYLQNYNRNVESMLFEMGEKYGNFCKKPI